MMTRNLQTLLLALGCAALLAACGSSPRHNFYLLSADTTTPGTGESPSIGVGPVAVPEYLARSNLVYEQEGNALTVSDTEHWAEPLPDGIARVVALNLSSLLDTHEVRMAPFNPARRPDYGVKIGVLALDSDDAGAELVAEWLVYRPDGGAPVARRISRLRMDSADGALEPAAVPGAYSELLLQLSEEIAAAVREDR